MTTSLKTIIPLALVSSFLLGYQYLGAQWVGPSVGPTSGNVPAPINVGNQDQVKSGGLSVGALSIYGGGLIESDKPTIEFSDTDHRDWWLHANTDRFYFLADRNDDDVWAGESPWPLELYAGPTPAQDVARFSNNVWAAGYCDENGNNCVDASGGGAGGGANASIYSSVGTQVFTVPAGVSQILVEVAGAGGGGGNQGQNGANGQNSAFSGNGFNVVGFGGRGGLGSFDDSPNRNAEPHVSGSGGTAHLAGKGAPGGMGATGEYQTTQYDVMYDGHPGNPGGAAFRTIPVTAGQSFTVTVGSGGSGVGSLGASGGRTSGTSAAGANGYVIVRW